MISKRQAVGVAIQVSTQVLQVHSEDLREYATLTGSMPLWILDASIAKRLQRWVKRASNVEEAILVGAQAFAKELRDSGYTPLQQVIHFRQALGTLMELSASKFGP